MLGTAVKYGTSLITAGISKGVTKVLKNNTINKFFKTLGVESTKIGTKSIWKITKGLANGTDNYIDQLTKDLITSLLL